MVEFELCSFCQWRSRDAWLLSMGMMNMRMMIVRWAVSPHFAQFGRPNWDWRVQTAVCLFCPYGCPSGGSLHGTPAAIPGQAERTGRLLCGGASKWKWCPLHGLGKKARSPPCHKAYYYCLHTVSDVDISHLMLHG